MRCTALLCFITAVVAALISGAVSLPPDFFRAGRGLPFPPVKKAVEADMDLVSAACSYCGAFSPSLELQCRRNVGDHRKVCAVALLNELQGLAEEKGWRPLDQQ